jgi:23S rRNA (pseudouridine1915-N3)-methyltransferase
MRFFVVAVGKLKDRALRALADDYLSRIRRSARCDEIELKSSAELSDAAPAASFRVALEVGGEACSSEAFARRIESWARRGKGEIAFLIGGADGLPEHVSRNADLRLSLSSMTLPHRLARVVLLEQIYRALTILRGEPYARED